MEKASHETCDLDIPLFEAQQIEISKSLSNLDSSESQTLFNFLQFCDVVAQGSDICINIEALPARIQHVLRQYAKTQKKPASPRQKAETPPTAKVRSFVKADTGTEKASKTFRLKGVFAKCKGQEAAVMKATTKIENIGINFQKTETLPITFTKC